MIISKKTQASAEFMILLAIILVIFISVLYFSYGTFVSMKADREKLHTSEICENVGWSINQVHHAGEGGFASIFLPNQIPSNISYNLTVYPASRLIEIRWGEKRYNVPASTSNISGQLVIYPGFLNITNINGGILLEQ